MTIEPLEARIAPAGILYHYTDLDGDAVTVTISKGEIADWNTVDVTMGDTLGHEFGFYLNNNPAFTDANITITAKPQKDAGGVLRGDGLVNIELIDATGINLGNVSVSGTLVSIKAGVSGNTGVGLKSLSVGALGIEGTLYATPDVSPIQGSIGPVKIKGDYDRAYLSATGGIASVSIGGDVIGTNTNNSGEIYAVGDLGPVTVKGNVIGGQGEYSGAIGAGGKVGNVTIGGVLAGGSGGHSGSIFSGYVVAGSGMGAIKIGGDLIGGNADGTKTGTQAGRIFASGDVASIAIGGAIRGNSGDDAGQISIGGNAGSITIGGSLLPERGSSAAGSILATGTIKTLAIGGSVLGGAFTTTGSITAQSIGTLHIGGDLAGSDAVQTGRVVVVKTLGSVTIGGEVHGGEGSSSGYLQAGETIGTVSIRGGLIGNLGDNTAYVRGSLGIAKITVGGSVVGGIKATNSGVIDGGTGRLGSVAIAGSLIGDRSFGADGTNTGSILARHIGSVTIGGSVFAGGGSSATALSGAIAADEEIGSIVIKGDLVGGTYPAKIYAGGLAGAPAAKTPALTSLTIGGNVDNALILAGVNRAGGIINGDTQIGAVKVGGAWKASSLASGVNPAEGVYGDGTDLASGASPHSKIASIVIGGPVFGIAGGTSTFGFAAHEIGSFKYRGLAVKLLAGAGNDLFAAGTANKAQAIGPSTSPSTAGKPDGYAVHIYEV